MTTAREPAPLYIVTIPPHHLCRLVGRGIIFLHDQATPPQPIASIDVIDEGTRFVPTRFEAHGTSGPFSRVTQTRAAGVCLALLDRFGRHVAVIVLHDEG